MIRWPPTLALLATAPLGVTAPGTTQGNVVLQKVQQGPVPVCMVNAAIDPDGAKFDNLGPTISLYRRDVAGGQVALSLPQVAHGTLATNGNTTVAAYDYISLGEASLDFTTPTTGSVTFIGGGNVLANPNAAPSFKYYRESWHKTSNELEVHVIFDMGGCALPIISYFQF
jgi:hypothetical protein